MTVRSRNHICKVPSYDHFCVCVCVCVGGGGVPLVYRTLQTLSPLSCPLGNSFFLSFLNKINIFLSWFAYSQLHPPPPRNVYKFYCVLPLCFSSSNIFSKVSHKAGKWAPKLQFKQLGHILNSRSMFTLPDL